jgi:hypothetical protein
MINPATEIDLDYRIYNKSKGEIKDSLEQVSQISRIKGIAFYKIVIKNSRNKTTEKYVTNLCRRKIAVIRIEQSIAYIAIIISIISLIVSVIK